MSRFDLGIKYVSLPRLGADTCLVEFDGGGMCAAERCADGVWRAYQRLA